MFDTSPWTYFLLSIGVLTVYWSISILRGAYRSDLTSLPGPKWAPFTALYRVYRLWSGQAPAVYLDLHEQYGPIVRTGPNTISIADPATIPTLYGISSNFLKSKFYITMSPRHEGEIMDSMFTTRDPARHKALKRPVAGKFSMTSIRTMEPLVNQCSEIFIQAMKDLEGQKVDLSTWLQWYAFDVIGMITFNKRFGFMEERKDILEMISSLEFALRYAGLVGQVPVLHPWLAGNPLVSGFMEKVVGLPNPLRAFVEFTQECIDEYDRNEKEKETADFLTFLRIEEKKNKENMPHRDLINHLSNNLLAGSDTTAISLRAILYYLVKTPTSYKRLQEEIDAADRAGKLSEFVSYGESLELEYLQVVMKEAMRVHPGVSYPLERLVPEGGADLCGQKLREGTVVGINPVVIHHNKEIFGDDAAVFRPERWLDVNEEQLKLMDRTLLTFGTGARSCIGKNISLMEMGKFVPQILRQFDLFWASDKPDWTVHTYWFARQSDFVVKFQTRKR
ncbi:cytochrome P450 [Hyaloscypha variabilis F]|uniref:Cytochrome P450 n=1 Tax=Hyaloscypha variabilis (strain UAMH 11265 / GT02V1 / F) TaxID=1149755 RepID=A0A2J6QTX5_HYAVF|nr:cytochrome P450 [Hyaloscypha variabilis F]